MQQLAVSCYKTDEAHLPAISLIGLACYTLHVVPGLFEPTLFRVLPLNFTEDGEKLCWILSLSRFEKGREIVRHR